jgi:hypothetical protein
MTSSPKMIEAGWGWLQKNCTASGKQNPPKQASQIVMLSKRDWELSLKAALAAMWSDDMESAPRPDKPSKHGWPQIVGEDIAGQLAVYFWNGRAFVNPDTCEEAKNLCRWMPLYPPEAP